MVYPDLDSIFILDTDASDRSIGADLSQIIQNGSNVVISYASKIVSWAQRRYCTTRKELLAIVAFAWQYRHYLLGNQFIIRTDHNSLRWLLIFKNIEGQFARWIEELSQCNLLIQHRAGKKHANADVLSSIPNECDDCTQYRSDVPLQDLPCEGCKYCKKVQCQWKIFEENIDYFIPLAIRAVNVSNRVETISIMGMLPNYSNGDLQELQRQDKHLSTVICWLALKHEPSKQEMQMCSPATRHLWHCKSQLKFENDVLYSVWEDNVKSRSLLVAPDSLKPELLRWCHDIRLAVI